MNDYVMAVLIAAGVFAAGLIVQWVAVRRGGELIEARSRRSLTRFAGVIALLAGLGWLLIRANPGTADSLVVSLLRSAPKLLLAAFIIVVSIVLGRLVGTVVARTLRSWSSVYASRIGRLVRLVIVSVGVIIALEQIGVSTELLIIVVAAVMLAASLSIALAAGLGSVPLAKNVAAGRHVATRFAVGQRVEGASFAGEIIEIGLSSVSLATEDGRTEVPHLLLLEHPVQVTDE